MSGGFGRLRPRDSGVEAAPRVVVIDDDASLRTTVRITLAAQGWTVTEAATPDEGVAAVERERPDIILLDVVFRGDHRDGFAVCRQLRELPASKDVPIVLFTANGDAESRAFASAVGATAFLVKPFGAIELQHFLKLVKGTAGTAHALGLYLIDAGLITAEQLERALAEQRLRQGEKPPLGRILTELGFVTQSQIDAALAKQRRSREIPPASALPAATRRVLIADDHERVRDGLRSAISAEDGLAVVGVAGDGDEALRLARTLRPDVIVLDSEMPRRAGLEVLPALRDELPETGVVMFTLDESVRERALELGARAVITKDQSLDVLIAAVRRAAAPPRPAASPPGVVLAARGVARSAWGAVLRQRRVASTMGVVAVGYTGAFLLFEPTLGASAAALAFLAVATAGAMLGLEGGLASGVLVSLLTAVLWAATGHEAGEPVATIGGNGIGVLAIIGTGAGFGAMRMMRGRLDAHARAASAIAEAAIALASANGPRVMSLVTAGALEAVVGECALLFLPVPGGGLELVAAHGAPAKAVGSRRVGQAVARAREEGHAFVTDASPAAIGVEVGGMRSALVAPIGPIASGSRGVIAVLSSRRGVFQAEHVATLAAYATFIGVAVHADLRAAPVAPAPQDVPGASFARRR